MLVSFLSNRNQYVSYNSYKSQLNNIKYGVPQGSFFGPLLFLIFINDILNIKSLGHFVLFADDTSITFHANNVVELETNMNNTLKYLDIWLSINKLTINLNKTNSIVFNNDKIKLAIILHNTRIIQKNSIKFLGVTIDANMNWKIHTNLVKSKLYYGISILRKLNKILPIHILKLLYYSVFHCHINYCTHIWGKNYEITTRHISIAQNKAIRLLYRKNNITNVDYIYKQQRIFTFKELLFVNTCKFMFRVIKGMIPQRLTNYFIRYYSKYNMRDSYRFINPMAKNNCKQFNITNNRSRCWNNLPMSLKSIYSSIIIL